MFEKILVTGGSGSTGNFLINKLIENYPSAEIYGLTRDVNVGTAPLNNVPKKSINWIVCDMRDFPNLERTIRRVRPNLIYNFASNANVQDSFSNSYSIFLNNNEIMINLLECIRNSEELPVLIHASTSEVYGKVLQSELPITEASPLRPASPYSVSKIAQDLLCDVYVKSFGLKIIKTRMFTYLNPSRINLFATSFAKQIVEIEQGKRDFLKHGNLDSIRTVLDIRDAVDAYIMAIKCKLGETYNIAGNQKFSVGEILKLLIKKSNAKIVCQQDPNLIRPNDVTLQIPDDSKFREITGWKPIYKIDESLNMLLEYWRAKLKN